MEARITAVERAQEYADLTPEAPPIVDDYRPPQVCCCCLDVSNRSDLSIQYGTSLCNIWAIDSRGHRLPEVCVVAVGFLACCLLLFAAVCAFFERKITNVSSACSRHSCQLYMPY